MAGVRSGPGVQIGPGTEPAPVAHGGAGAPRSDLSNSGQRSQGNASPPIRRAVLLAAAGAATVALAYALAPGEENGVVLAASGARSAAAPSAERGAATHAAEIGAVARAEIPLKAKTDPFVATSFAPPPPPPPPVVAAPPPPPPKAPPLPFTFVGLLESGPRPTAFLARGDALLLVSAGQIVDNDYRIESMSPTEIVLTYLPLKERQSLNVTGAKP